MVRYGWGGQWKRAKRNSLYSWGTPEGAQKVNTPTMTLIMMMTMTLVMMMTMIMTAGEPLRMPTIDSDDDDDDDDDWRDPVLKMQKLVFLDLQMSSDTSCECGRCESE